MKVFIPIEKLINATYTNQYEDIEAKAVDLDKMYNIDDSEGAQLDIIGNLVGLPRNTEDDEKYRLYLKAQAVINSSQGRINQLLTALDFMSDESSSIAVYSMALDIYADVDYPTAVFIKQAIQKAVMAGVKVLTVQPVNAGAFGFLGTPNSGTFGTVTDPEVGGHFSHIIT